MLEPKDIYDDEDWSDIDDFGQDIDFDAWPNIDDDNFFDDGGGQGH